MPNAIVHPETARPASVSSLSDEANYLGQFIPLHYHFQMLQDRQRLFAFREAIQKHVKPGMHVVELGGGTGVLSSFAAKCGARVTCVERNPELAQFARETIRKNGLSKQIEVVLEDAREFVPNDRTDAVICEMLHVGLIREKQTEVIRLFKENYRRRWGDPLPRFLPEASRLLVQLVDYSFDFEGYYAPLPVFQSPNQNVNDDVRELSPLVDYEHLFYDQEFADGIDWKAEIPFQSEGLFSALRFITQNFISVETNGESPTWCNQFLILPISEPTSIIAGQSAQVAFSYRFGEPIESLQQSIQVEVSCPLNTLRNQCEKA